MIKEYVIQVIQNAIAYHLLTDAQLVSEQGQPAWPAPPTSIAQHDTIWYGISPGTPGQWFSRLGSVLSQLLVHPQFLTG